MRFIKRSEPDHTMVSVRLGEREGKARGEVFLPMRQRGETLTTASVPDGGALTAAEALGFATTQAMELRTDVAVVDPEGLWRPEWGTLHDGPLETKPAPAEAAETNGEPPLAAEETKAPQPAGEPAESGD